MPRALKPLGGEFTHVLECDRELPEHEQARWTMRPLRFGEREHIRDLEAQRMTVQEEGSVRPHFSQQRVHLQILHYALRLVENFKDDAGECVNVEREGGRLTDRFLERLDEEWIGELAKEAWERSNLSENDQKNS